MNLLVKMEHYRHCYHLWMLVQIVFMVQLPQGGQCLKDVSLRVQPAVVQLGSHAALFCNYDLEHAPLYSVKWYRGNFEFYRYSPGENPPTKIFPYSGIHVDLSVSNESVVVLRKVGFNLSGNFSCEVTVEAPSFSTATVYQQMLVVALPDTPPVISTERERYNPGDILRANCTSPKSKPPASLSFHLNNIPVSIPEVRQYRKTPDSLHESWLTLTTQVYPSHYTSNGQLILKCTALIGTIYRMSTEIQLGARAREPVPERVTSQGSSGALSVHASTLPLHVAILIISCHVTR